MDTREDIKIALMESLSEEIDIPMESITEDMSLKDDLGLDSLELVNIGLTLEDRFGIEIGDGSIEKFINVRDTIEEVLRLTVELNRKTPC